jgi:hypothetical protein
MNSLKLAAGAAIAIFALVSLSAPSAYAQQSPACAWGCVYAPDQTKRQNNLNAAAMQEIARRNGYGPGDSFSTVNIGTQTNNETHTGPETDASAVNIVNSNTVETNANGSNIVVTTGTNQTSGTATQGATAQTTTSTGSGQVSTTATGHNNN